MRWNTGVDKVILHYKVNRGQLYYQLSLVPRRGREHWQIIEDMLEVILIREQERARETTAVNQLKSFFQQELKKRRRK